MSKLMDRYICLSIIYAHDERCVGISLFFCVWCAREFLDTCRNDFLKCGVTEKYVGFDNATHRKLRCRRKSEFESLSRWRCCAISVNNTSQANNTYKYKSSQNTIVLVQLFDFSFRLYISCTVQVENEIDSSCLAVGRRCRPGIIIIIFFFCDIKNEINAHRQ